MQSYKRWLKRGGAGNIDAAWKAKKRKKTGLVQRTLEANRKQLKKLAKTSDVKQTTKYVAADDTTPPWQGQIFEFQAGNAGQDVGGTNAVVCPLMLAKGDENDKYNGDCVTLCSLSYHVEVNAETGPLAADFNRVGMIVVLDRKPQGPEPNLNGGAGGAGEDLGTLLTPSTPGTFVRPYLQFKNKNTTDAGDQPEPRYEILRHHKGIVQPQLAGSTRFANVIFSGQIKGQYKFQYPDRPAGAALPINKRILIFCYSDSEVYPAPVFRGYCRYRFRDV